MENEHTVSTLTKLHAKLRGEIEALAHVDSVLRLLVPDYDFADVKPKYVRPDPKKFRGAVQSIIFDEIRRRGQATPRELVDRLMEERGLALDDGRARAIIQKRVKDRLGGLRRQGKIESVRASHEGAADVRVWKVRDSDR